MEGLSHFSGRQFFTIASANINSLHNSVPDVTKSPWIYYFYKKPIVQT